MQAPLVTVDLQRGAVTTFMQWEKGRHKPHVSVPSVSAAGSNPRKLLCLLSLLMLLMLLLVRNSTIEK